MFQLNFTGRCWHDGWTSEVLTGTTAELHGVIPVSGLNVAGIIAEVLWMLPEYRLNMERIADITHNLREMLPV